MAISNPKKYTVTAALIYANGPIHIGHLAGCYVPADIYVRYLRSKGAEVAFISGTDEHGVPITIRAKKEGLTPQEVVDKYYVQIRDAFADLGISFDVYSRTSLPVHHQTSQEFFTTLYDKGSFTEEVTEQYFDETAQQFLADRYIVGTCPVCDNPNAYGDQCERCGSTLSPLELKDPRSMLSGGKPVLKSTKNWYLPLDKLQPQIETYVNGHTEWKSNVFGQCQSWLKDGLRPRAMTRDLDWGVPVPIADTEGKVLYVWFEAPIGYVSATRDWLIQKNGTDAGWESWWKKEDGNDQETKLVHFIGKDNIVFHCIIFPAMCMEEGSYLLADNVPANEFMNLEGDKISTSRNWAVWLHEYLEDFPGKQDVLRYVLTANAPEAKDSEFTWKDFQTRNNSELVGIFGNFINRAAVLTHKYCEGRIPAKGSLETIDKETLAQLAQFPGQIGNAIENYKLREALSLIMDLARLGNKYLADTQPWHVIKTDPDRVNTILNVALQIAGSLAIVAEPVMPFVSATIRELLSIDGSAKWNDAGNADLLQAGQVLAEPKLLFEKIEDAQIEKQVQKLLDAKKQNELEGKVVAEVKPEIQFDDFSKIDIRVATIVEAEAVPKSKKLLKLKVDIGLEQRTVLSGISEHFKPEEIIGRQVLYLANLAPRKMMGQESQGMILMAEDRDGSLTFVQPGKDIWNGATVN